MKSKNKVCRREEKFEEASIRESTRHRNSRSTLCRSRSQGKVDNFRDACCHVLTKRGSQIFRQRRHLPRPGPGARAQTYALTAQAAAMPLTKATKAFYCQKEISFIMVVNEEATP